MDKICFFAECFNIIESVGSRSDKKFCSSSCSAKHNNKHSPKRKKEGRCKECGAVCQSSRMYCPAHKHLAYDRKKVSLVKKKKNNNRAKVALCIKCKQPNEILFGQRICEICKRLRAERVCQNSLCGKKFNPHHESMKTKYCSLNCSEYVRLIQIPKNKINKWLRGEWAGGTNFGLSQTIRKYLLEQADYKCTECGFNKLHPSDGSCILEIDHVDGDSTNHNPKNLKVLCPNCHALTPTYKARNVGKGRKNRYKEK